MLLLGLLGVGALVGSAIKCGMENAEFMSKPQYRHECGKDVYRDRLGHTYIDGKQVYISGDQIMDLKTAQVIWDKRVADNDKACVESVNRGKLAHFGNHFRFAPVEVLIENKTGKVISMLQRNKMPDGTYECRKWYAFDMCAYKYGGAENARYCYKEDNNMILDDDEGIVISEDEFNRLNIGNKFPNEYFLKDDKTGVDDSRYKRINRIPRKSLPKKAY